LIVLSDEVEVESFPNEELKEKIFQKTEQFLDQMNIEEIVSSFFCLTQITQSDLRDPLVIKLIERITNELKKDGDFPTICLARYSFPFSHQKDLYSTYFAVQILPQTIKQLEKCTNVDDLNNITMTLNNLCYLVSNDNLKKFKNKVQEFLDNELINMTTISCILRIINFLNHPHWSIKNSELIRDLCLEIEEKIPTFTTRHLMTLNKAFQTHLESSKILGSIVKRSHELILESPSAELLSMAVLHVTPDQRTKTANMIKQILMQYQITSTSSNDTLQMVFKILRLLKISDINLCDSFWLKALNEIYGTKVPALRFKLAQYTQKYMFFNNNLGGTYRNIEFETSVIDMLNDELKKPITPKEFAMFSSFIIAYTDTSEVPQFIVDKIETLHEQFSVRDCWQLSRGIQISQEIRLKQFRTEAFVNQVNSMNYSLMKTSQIHLDQEEFSLSKLNRIVRAHIFRKGKIFHISENLQTNFILIIHSIT
jgi:hypothetical protein